MRMEWWQLEPLPLTCSSRLVLMLTCIQCETTLLFTIPCQTIKAFRLCFQIDAWFQFEPFLSQLPSLCALRYTETLKIA